MSTLVVVRHGPTIYSRENRFAGWHDTPLTTRGHEDARRAGETLRHAGLEFDVCFTSRLLRAEQTLRSILTSVRIDEDRIERDWRLNERHYGALQGQTRGAIVASYGNAQVVEWRRSYDALPPLLGDDDPRCIEQLARFRTCPRTFSRAANDCGTRPNASLRCGTSVSRLRSRKGCAFSSSRIPARLAASRASSRD